MLECASKTSWKRINKNNLTWSCVLKTSFRHLCKRSWRCLEDILQGVLKMSWRRFSKTSWIRLEDVCKTSWQDALETSGRRLEIVFKTSWRCIIKINMLVLFKTSWRRLEDVFWRRVNKANMFVLIKTSWKRLLKTKAADIFKTSSLRQMFAGKRLNYVIKFHKVEKAAFCNLGFLPLL